MLCFGVNIQKPRKQSRATGQDLVSFLPAIPGSAEGGSGPHAAVAYRSMCSSFKLMSFWKEFISNDRQLLVSWQRKPFQYRYISANQVALEYRFCLDVFGMCACL